jgi:hypothetical protein
MTTPDNTQADQYTATVKEPINDPINGGHLPHIDGYDSRADVPIGEFPRPDLWHLAYVLGDTGIIAARFKPQAKADILNTWGALADFQTLALEQETTIRNLQAELAELKAAHEPTPERLQAAWEAVAGSLPTWEWWREFKFMAGATWDRPGELAVTGENPNDETKTITKTLTARDFLAAYDKLRTTDNGGQHCGTCDLIDDPDDCSSDLLLQQAMYGEIVYG